MQVVRIAHSPDPDDAFMAWALHAGVVRDPELRVELVPLDIETANQMALRGEGPEATALSMATFARVADRYWLLPHGASFGEGYGPIVVARKEVDLREVEIAAPGAGTTAYATLRMALPRARCRQMPFDAILPAVQRGEAEAGLLIHEGQLTWQREGVVKLLDLGVWWKEETGLPLPLGVTAIRKDVGPALAARVDALMRASIEAGLARRAEALAYARGFGRGIPLEDADRFVAMYVNDLTRDMRPRGLAGVHEWVRRAAEAGIVPRADVHMAPSP
ncbi:MAG: 1,4-dihydroxy-6-naphthoate synthase [Thermoplasmata archaeon]|jgi:1,4-dihydroxy-6-naphthoate synthase|nr:1,4-dihydroxy-6-naphthoate synthase [Thermoplasmata archaeon]